MEKEKLEGMLIDYIDGTLGEEGVSTIETLLASDESVRVLYNQLKEVITTLDHTSALEPSPSLESDFTQALKEEIARTNKPGRQVFFSPVVYRAAAAVVFIMVSVGLGYWVVKTQQQQAELEALRKEMNDTKNVMMAMLENQQSASTRMKGATVAFNMEKPDDQIVRALVKTMNEDPNTNVRLAALEALGKFREEKLVRKALIGSLATQKDPSVQIALIQLMVQMKEKGVVKDLENIVNDDQTMKAVKDEAYSGLLKLS